MTTPEEVQRVRDAGATGVQVGTLFAFSKESGLIPPLRDEVLHELKEGRLKVSTDVRASPTGFPFKVVHLAGTNAGPDDYQRRPRLCDLGYLRTPYRREDGRIGYRCPAEPIADFAKKGGAPEETAGRKCLCNGLLANIGQPQRKGDVVERPLLTGGSDLDQVREFAKVHPGYTATEVVEYLLGQA
jgi:NAD(P)H-dependent flavin oxidoreductase YrpB (nitropropane dioxygenase family)